MKNRKFILVWLLFASALVVGWTELVDNFYGKNLDKTTFQAPATNGIPKYDGTKWVVGTDSGGPETLSISDLTDVGAMTEVSGDTFYFDGSTWTRLAKGSDGQVLKLASGLPSWATDSGGAETLASTDLTDFSAAKTGTGTSVVSNTGPTINTPTLVTPTITVTGTATTVLHGSVAGAASFSAVTASDADTTITNRLNPTPATVGNIPVDAGAATPYTFIDGSDADTTKALFATGAAAAPAFRVLAGGDIDELIRLEELLDVATMTEAAGDMLVRNAGNTAWDRLDMTDADTTKALFSTGASSLPALRNLAQSDIDELLSISDLTDVGAMTEAAGDLLVVVGTTWTNLTKGSNSTVLNVSSSGTVGYSTITDAMVGGNVLTAASLAANSVDTSEIVGGAPGASGAEFADSVTNITAATDLTITATGDEVILGDQLKYFGSTGDPTNEQDSLYDTTQGIVETQMKVGKVRQGGVFKSINSSSTAISSTGSDVEFDNTPFTLPASVIQDGTVISFCYYGIYTSSGTPGNWIFKLFKGSTQISGVNIVPVASSTNLGWRVTGTINGRGTTTVTYEQYTVMDNSNTASVPSSRAEVFNTTTTISSSSEVLSLKLRLTNASQSATCLGGWVRID